MWWDVDTIERTVTRQFVCSHLLPEEIARLDLPLGFGDGLTDGTYWEWIDEKAKRIFLILVDLGVPDQIFGVIDDSWDDEDLPIALDQVERLALTRSRDEKAERKFYYRQFQYLLRPIEAGEHMTYQDVEIVPLDVVEKRQNSVDKVELPNMKSQLLCRRRIPLGTENGYLSEEDFLYEISTMRNLQNEHLVSYWASYVHLGYGYVLFTPSNDFNLKTLLATPPNSFKNLDKPVRRQLIMDWIHCLVDTLCFIHNRGLSHGNIKPSTVLFTDSNHIFYSDFTQFNTEVLASATEKGGGGSFDRESYDYAAPEQWFRPTSGPTSPVHRKGTFSSVSSSPEDYAFSISRSGEYSTSGGSGGSSSRPQAMMSAPNPHLNPQAADVFSLGCVILELLGVLLKRQTRAFATHRGARHKSAGRGGAVLDSSFHKNLGQVESWMAGMAKDSAKKDDTAFRGVVPMLHVVERMLAFHPAERPSAHDVQARMYQIITESCGVAEPHCVHQYGGWDFGIGSLRMMSPPPTAAGPVMMMPEQPSTALSMSRVESAEVMSIMTKSSTSSSGSSSRGKERAGGTSSSVAAALQHRRTHSGTGGVTGSTSGSSRARAMPRKRERELAVAAAGGYHQSSSSSGRSRDKGKQQWQAPVYAV